MKRALLYLMLSLTARAAVGPALSLRELVDGSSVIAHGRVARSWTAWDSSHKYIWTHYQLEVIDPIRGVGFAPLVVSEPGGKLDGVNMRFSGAAQYAPGEEAIVFLYRTPIGYLRVLGQGKFRPSPELKTRVREALRRR
jgi:hypothetical protein